MATATYPTLLWAPIFHHQEDEDNGFTFFNAGGFAESSLCKQAWRNPKEDRVGCLHQNIFMRKVTDIAFTSDFCNNYSHPVSPASLYFFQIPTPPPPLLISDKSLIQVSHCNLSNNVAKYELFMRYIG